MHDAVCAMEMNFACTGILVLVFDFLIPAIYYVCSGFPIVLHFYVSSYEFCILDCCGDEIWFYV